MHTNATPMNRNSIKYAKYLQKLCQIEFVILSWCLWPYICDLFHFRASLGQKIPVLGPKCIPMLHRWIEVAWISSKCLWKLCHIGFIVLFGVYDPIYAIYFILGKFWAQKYLFLGHKCIPMLHRRKGVVLKSSKRL